MKIAAQVVLLAFLAACQGQGSRVVPLPVLREVPVRFSARLESRQGATAEQKSAQSSAAGDAAAESTDVVQILLDCQYWEVAAPDEGALFAGDVSRTFGRVVSEPEFERACGEWERCGMATRSGRAEFGLAEGGRGELRLAFQTAYVQAFDFQSVGDAIFADPSIAVLTTGLEFEAAARPSAADGATIWLDLSFKKTSLVQLAGESDVRVPGFDPSIALQIPIVFAQDLSSSVELGRGEVFVLGSLAPDAGGRRIVATVRAHHAPPSAVERAAASRDRDAATVADAQR